MKIGYFYASSPEIEYPEVPSLPPLPGLLCIESKALPNEVYVAINVGILGLPENDPHHPYSVYVRIFFDGEELSTPDTESLAFRYKAYSTPTGILAMRHSFLEKFNIEKYGIYTFCAYLYNKHLDEKPEDEEGLMHTAECSVFIANEWR